MRDDVRGELSLSDLAQSVNLSVWRLSHIFKSDVGVPPIKYLRLLRMERAKKLLESSFLSVKEIAYQVGLNDESHFVRDFKSTYGSSPACYRSQFRNNTNDDAARDNSASKSEDAHQEGKPSSNVRKQLALVAKQSILPSLQLLVVAVSCF